MNDDQFRCSICREIFISEGDNEEAIEVFKKDFPGKPIGEASTLCDKCYSAFKQWQKSPEGIEAARLYDQYPQSLIQSIVKVTGIPEDVLLGKK